MWKLTIEDDEGKRTPVLLVHDEYAVGRAEGNAIRLTERNISRKHAVLKRNGKSWLVHDLDSYNGCFVNGVRVAGEHALAHGDLIQLGDYKLEFLDEDRAQKEGEEAVASTVPVPRSLAAAVKPDRLVVVVGPNPGEEFPLLGERMTIGRAEEATVCLPHASVSRIHAEIHALGGGRFEVIDKESSNGIRVNGSQLRRGLIEAGDVIELGDCRLKFVGAGQIWRPGPEATAPVVQASERPSPSGPPAARSERPVARPFRPSGGLGKMVVLGAGIGLAVIFVYVAVSRRGPEPEPPAAGAAQNLASQIFDEARKLQGAGNLEAAHAKLGELPPTSSLRDSPQFRDIESQWADGVLARAEREGDPAVRRALLAQVSNATTVDSGRRTRAADALAQLDPRGTDPSKLPAVATSPSAPEATAALAPGGIERRNPFEPGGKPAPGAPAPPGKTAMAPAPPPEKTAAPPKETATPPPGGKSAIDLAKDGQTSAARKALEPRVWSGKASVDEIRQLIAICGADHDMACRARARDVLRQKQDQQK